MAALVIAQSSTVSAASTNKVSFSVNAFIVEGENQLSQQDAKKVLADYLGDHDGLDKLYAAAKALESAHAKLGYAFHRVVIPPQTMTNGSIILKVVSFDLGQTKVIGNTYFDDEHILKSLPSLQSGSVVNTRELARELSLANRHPVREHVVNIKKGLLPDTVDAEIKVKDSRPYLGFINVNNIGSSETGRLRVTAGGQHTNLFGFDDVFTASYTTSQLHPNDVKQYGLSYAIPFYDYATRLTLFHSRSDVDSGTINSLDISGAGKFTGFNINHILLPLGNYSHEWSIGVVDKLFENNALFSGINLTSDVRSRPLTLAYIGQYKTPKYQLKFSGSLSTNLESGNKNNQAEYQANRSGSDTDWHHWNIDGYINYFLEGDWLLRGIFESQLTSDALIPGEQFGLGGMNSIRGFEERSVTGDSGVRVSSELWTPAIKSLYGVRLLAFIDYGYMDREKVQIGEEKSDSVASIGVGARWNWKENVSLSLDYGHVINEAEHLRGTTADSGNAKTHFNMLIRF